MPADVCDRFPHQTEEGNRYFALLLIVYTTILCMVDLHDDNRLVELIQAPGQVTGSFSTGKNTPGNLVQNGILQSGYLPGSDV